MSEFRDYVDRHMRNIEQSTKEKLLRKSSLTDGIPINKHRSQLMTDTSSKIEHDLISDILDSDQLQAVEHRGSNLLIIAGAGSGKTRTLTHRAVSFLQEIEPENLMVITFTKKAAMEFSTELIKLFLSRNVKV